jgi:transcriptional regulator with XRE-family HTH domain
VSGGEFLVQRPRLAAELRRLRMDAGLSTNDLARRLAWSQSKVSKMELGRTAAAVADVEAWCRATGGAADLVERLREQAERALTEASAYRGGLGERLPRQQRDIAALERATGCLRSFQPTVIPGLLQTAEYAQRIFESGHTEDEPAVALAVAARVERQSILYEPDHDFEFIIGEAAFRWRFAARHAMAAQVGRVRTIAALPNVRLGILPLAVEGPVWQWHGLTLYEERLDGGDPLVVIETLTSSVRISDPDDIDRYRRMLERLRATAVFGDSGLDRVAEASLSSLD